MTCSNRSILDDDDRVHPFPELADALLGDVEAPATFEGERPRDDTDRERAHLVRKVGDDRRAPVPVPPPSPAVTNTMSAPFSTSLSSSRDS